MLKVADGKIAVQGIGRGRLSVAKDGEIFTADVDFSEKSVFALDI